MINDEISKFIQKCLSDVKVELSDEFDRNFDRQAFFTQAWQRRVYNDDGHPLLQQTGALRKSIYAKIEDNRITFYSELAYADIHNSGGKIMVTKAMKAHFWKKYYAAMGTVTYRKSGEIRQTAKNRVLTAEQAFYKAMALKREGSYMTIPRREFLGKSPEVEQIVMDIVTDNLEEFFKEGNNFKIDINYTERHDT